MRKRFIGEREWFFEDMKLNDTPTFTWGVVLEKELFSGKSKFQKIEVFDTKEFGRIMTLDGLVQFSEKHEFVYHEMLVHPAFSYCKNPKSVLIIGGGDGGVLREVVKYPVKEIFLVDIDEKVTEVSKKFLPSISHGAFSDKRVRVLHQDALKFIKNYRDYFDIIIDDLTDPTGPSTLLWGKQFYKLIFKALKKDGVAGFQTAYLKEKFAKKTRDGLKRFFSFFAVHRAYVGCFPFDEHTFSFVSKTINLKNVNQREIEKSFKIKTRYYSPEIHFSSLVMPKYVGEK